MRHHLALGLVTSTRINYGLDTNYGNSATGTAYGGYRIWFYTDLSTLRSGATYHYQIVATDTQGNTLTTADAIFTVPLWDDDLALRP